MENSAYLEGVAGHRAVLAYNHDEEGALDGAQLISAETDPDLQREWEDILESHGLSAECRDTALNRACYFGNPRAYTDEKSDYSTFIDGLRAEPKAWWLEPSRPVVPIRIITPEELSALDPGGSALSYFVDQRTKYRFNAYSSELQAARFRGKRHTAEHNRKMSEALKEAWKRVTPEEKARRIAARVARGYQKCRPGCTCAKHDPEVCAKRREKLTGKKHNMSPEGLWRQDVARRRRKKGQLFLELSFS